MDMPQFVQVSIIATGIGALLSVFYLAEQVRVATLEGRIQRTYEYMKRYNSPEFREDMAMATIFFRDRTRSNQAKWEAVKTDDILKSQIVLSMNFFEELGIMYNKNLLEKTVAREFFGSISKSICEDANDYINERRKDPKDEKNYKNWETMNKSF